MIRRLSIYFLALSLSLPAWANEGMWLPMMLGRSYEDMKAHGLQLSQDEIYSLNQPSIKDAIVSFGGFCTGEIISPKGLILTNHHCGYDAIRTHSDTVNNYLDHGFWAKKHEEEKPTEGLFVKFMLRMEDVSDRINSELGPDMTETQRSGIIDSVRQVILKEVKEENPDYEAEVKSFFHGNEFYLFLYESYPDVRLVGAPPSAVGKFGGDTDNWMWPRHTGDFSLFRVYTAPDGSPAEYSEDNVPMKPRHYLPVSLDGVQEGDFTMVFGFPGRTDRYRSSYGVEQALNYYNPSIVEVRDRKLAIMKKYMNASDKTRLQYASKYARVSNYWKYFIGQTEQLKNNKVQERKKAIENRFAQWVQQDPQREERYGETLDLLRESYAATDSLIKARVYSLEAGLSGSDISMLSFRLGRIMDAYFDAEKEMENALDTASSDESEESIRDKYTTRMESLLAQAKDQAKEHFENYHLPLDRELLAEMLQMYDQNIDPQFHPEFLKDARKKYKGDWTKYANRVFKKSMLSHEEDLLAFLDNPKAKKWRKDIASDLGADLYDTYQQLNSGPEQAQAKKNRGYRLLTAGLREMNPNREYFPDANSTLRLTYGTVGSYQARDAVHYDYYTTGAGILEKKDNSDDEFIVPDRLTRLLEKGEYGRYANARGELPVNFIHNTDITGGNSGSPVINGRGHLIGCAFDGNWEAMSGDIFFEDELQRTISVDARYILFIMDKYAGAHNLIEELTLVNGADRAEGKNAPRVPEKNQKRETPEPSPALN